MTWVTAVAWFPSLAQELLQAVGAAKKIKQNKTHTHKPGNKQVSIYQA